MPPETEFWALHRSRGAFGPQRGSAATRLAPWRTLKLQPEAGFVAAKLAHDAEPEGFAADVAAVEYSAELLAAGPEAFAHGAEAGKAEAALAADVAAVGAEPEVFAAGAAATEAVAPELEAFAVVAVAPEAVGVAIVADPGPGLGSIGPACPAFWSFSFPSASSLDSFTVKNNYENIS